MKKILLMGSLLFLCSCASSLKYDHTKFSINPDVKLISIDTTSVTRERDGQMLAQVSLISKKNQSVYYKFEWFDVNSMKISTKLSKWKKVNLRQNDEFVFNSAAPTKRAVTYKVYITNNIGNGIIE